MKPERVEYQALLESLADGVEIDWAALDTFAETDLARRRYRNLRLVARVAELHRTLGADDNGPATKLTVARHHLHGRRASDRRIAGRDRSEP